MKYRLKRDLPGYPAGSVFWADETGWHSEIGFSNTTQGIVLLEMAKNDPDWFEPIKEVEKQWSVSDPIAIHSGWAITTKMNTTEAQAEAVSVAIKALLEYVHADNYNLTDEGEAAHIREVLYKARKAVQEEV